MRAQMERNLRDGCGGEGMVLSAEMGHYVKDKIIDPRTADACCARLSLASGMGAACRYVGFVAAQSKLVAQ
jgi:hypothetical protein